jgi:hnRNP-L/PTB/hephaestus splicing factor
VNSLVETHVTPDVLFTLFGVYGDVIRVKILFNKKSCAMVQMATPQQAQLALQYLHNTEVFGTAMSVTLSRHMEVALPGGGKTEEVPLTKDYTGSKLHRFRVPSSKNARHVFAPSPVLHVSNLPPGVTVDEIRAVFEQALDEKDAQQGLHVVFFGPDVEKKPMAYVTLPSVSAAVSVLLKTHNFLIKEKYLRVTFANPNKGDGKRGDHEAH